jgi:hypothetical protein
MKKSHKHHEPHKAHEEALPEQAPPLVEAPKVEAPKPPPAPAPEVAPKAVPKAESHDDPDWKKGPLPQDTWDWGGVVPVGETSGFYFADFCGNHVKIVGLPGADGAQRILQPDEVALYNNCLKVPAAMKAAKPLAARRE